MKRIFIFGIISLLAVGSVFAEKSTLIDFSQLAADGEAEEGATPQKGVPAKNAATTVNTANHASNNYTDAQKEVMQTSLAIENWKVKLSSSSASVGNQSKSYTKEATSKTKFADSKVMGVRVHFPVGAWNATASIVPPFEIPAYEPKDEADEGDTSTKFEGGYGVLKNVGVLKSVAVQVYGEYFPYTLYAILINDKGVEIPVNLGSLNFYGWATLTWENPRYVSDVRDRALNPAPLYPQSLPFIKFGGFRIVRTGDQPGGDFVTYFKDVQVIYDKALEDGDDDDRDIEDESVWNIVSEREAENNKGVMNKLSDQLYREYLDGKRQATETFDSTEQAEADG